MSGEAGAAMRGEHYGVFVGSGRIVSLATVHADGPGGADGEGEADFFARTNAPYDRWLARARPRLDALFRELVAEGLPLVPIDTPFEEVDGLVIDERDSKSASDAKADHHRRFSRGLPGPVHLRGAHLMPGGQTLNLRVLVSRRVRRVELEPMLARVAAVLRETEAEPAPEAEPEPPKPVRSDAAGSARASGGRPSFVARAVAWLRGRR